MEKLSFETFKVFMQPGFIGVRQLEQFRSGVDLGLDLRASM